MRTRILGLVAALAFTLSARPVGAVDAPHNQTFSDGQCDNCHGWFVAKPSGNKDFSPGCVRCHNFLDSPSPFLKFPWHPDTSQALPGIQGDQHNWTGVAQNKSAGARSPTSSAIAQKLVDGALQCATCHDIHSATPAHTPDSRRTSPPVGVGTGQITVTESGTAAQAWRIRVQTASAPGVNPATGTFVISHDFGLSVPTWFKFEGGAWVPGGADPTVLPGKAFTEDVAVELDDPATKVKFTGESTVGDYWDFYIGYPALRATNVGDAFCYSCHAERVMNHVRVSGNDPGYQPDGERVFSHPVSVALTKPYDRIGAVLDADGSTQAVGDQKSSNDLELDGALVRCTTCHSVHNADSNSLSD